MIAVLIQQQKTNIMTMSWITSKIYQVKTVK